MLYILFITSYFIDVIILILFIFLIITLLRLIKSLGNNYNLSDSFNITPDLITNQPHQTFTDYAAKKKIGVYSTSYHQHKNINKVLKRIIKGALGFVALKFIIVTLIFLNIPRPSVAQPEQNIFQDQGYLSFSKGSYNLTAWDQNGITLQPGQLSGNFISQPIGNGKMNKWQTLSWQTDGNYNQKPEYPKETLVVWSLDALDKCAEVKYQKYNCNPNKIVINKGVYNSSSYVFDGFTSSAKISANVPFGDTFTIGAWIRPAKNILNGSQDINYTIFSKAFGDYTAKKPYELTNNIFFGIKEGSLQLIYWSDNNRTHWVRAKDNNYNFLADKWVHVTGVFDKKNNSLKIYIDSFDHTDIVEDYDGGAINHSPANTSYPSWLGSSGYLWQDKEEKTVNIFNGNIDEVFIINKILGPIEIRNFITQASEIYFQVRTGNFLPLNGTFWGPNGQSNTYFTKPAENNLDFLTDSKYLQYIAFINRPNTYFFPKINNVSVNYLAPESTDFKITTVEEQKFTVQIPAQRDLQKEAKAIELFISYFKTKPNTKTDWDFVNLVAYNKISKRNLDKEIPAVVSYIKHFKKLPKTDTDWGFIKALAYNSRGGELMAAWQK
ncbi:MAG: hypothetical protein A2Y82_03400 [Candidatus Buchananbacteria bacterium RBG_13_36_9]|uniref:LamG-like jellyroll fold domain-containing protein n=1 Tax=Candidatus Buchananbacteria bacterium RBG_13_36_9 TaxID=1797530 RepID=A0A1G1XMS5_9BACT|nr:MAG: hypothetical protein A2Y82_03400 [Candidatus Buchananbacteria bacterium RBG_13_36_9]